MPKQAITAALVRDIPSMNLKPRSRIHDAPLENPPKRRTRNKHYPGDVRGFFIRIGRNPQRFGYYLDYTDHIGNRHTLRIAKGTADPEFARKLAADALAEVSKGGNPAGDRIAARRSKRQQKQSKLGQYLIGDGTPDNPNGLYWNRVLVNNKAGKATLKRICSAWRTLLNKPMASIKPAEVHALLDARDVSEATRSRDLVALKACLNVAATGQTGRGGERRTVHERLIESNPLANQARKYNPNRDGQRVRWLGEKDPDEPRRFMRAVMDEQTPDYLRCMVLLARNTGMRRGEMFSLEWRDVNMHRREIMLRAENTKSNKARRISLNAVALKGLRAWQGRKEIRLSPLVFPNPGSGKRMTHFKRSWANLLSRAEVTDLTFHDLRHDFASQLRLKGVPLEVVRDALGHSSIQLTERYAHVGDEELRDAVAMLAE
jgi:integrase